jgi:hypothetical protein
MQIWIKGGRDQEDNGGPRFRFAATEKVAAALRGVATILRPPLGSAETCGTKARNAVAKRSGVKAVGKLEQGGA